MVVEAEFNGANKTTLRSERSCVPKKEKREQKIQKKILTRAGIVRDVWLVLRGVCFLAVGGIASAQNPIVIENQQPASSQWQIPWGGVGSDAIGQVKGYASAVSVNKGQNITFYVSVNPAQNYSIDVRT